MPLRKPWKPLKRSTIGSVPDSYGVYELGDGDGNVISVEAGPLRDGMKDALAYGDGSQVRWEAAQTPSAADKLLEEHRERL